VSVAARPPAGTETPAAQPPPAPPGEACPLCGAPLHPEQEWCLNCGAAARTRLAASPRWKGLIATLAVVVALSLGVLAAALVKLVADSDPAPATTRTVTTAAAVVPTTSTAVPSTSLPATGASTIGTATTPATTSTGTAAPGTTGANAPGTKRAKREAKGFGLGKVVEELLEKRKLLPHSGTR
jgi:hypothetical protein